MKKLLTALTIVLLIVLYSCSPMPVKSFSEAEQMLRPAVDVRMAPERTVTARLVADRTMMNDQVIDLPDGTPDFEKWESAVAMFNFNVLGFRFDNGQGDAYILVVAQDTSLIIAMGVIKDDAFTAHYIVKNGQCIPTEAEGVVALIELYESGSLKES